MTKMAVMGSEKAGVWLDGMRRSCLRANPPAGIGELGNLGGPWRSRTTMLLLLRMSREERQRTMVTRSEETENANARG